MECDYHPGTAAVARCVTCGKCLCESCVRESGNRKYCFNCAPADACETEHLLVRVEDLEVSRAFTYMIDDPRWPIKLLTGSLFMIASMLVVPFFFILGYQLEVVRRVAAGEVGLPEWDRLGRKFKDGAALFLVMLVYGIPLFIVLAAVIVLGVLVGRAPTHTIAHGVVLGIAVLGFVVGWLVVLAGAALLELAGPAIAGTFAKKGSISFTLQPGVIVGLVKADFKAYLLVFVVSVFILGAISAAGLIACCIGAFVTTFYAVLVAGHLIGQLARLNPVGDEPDA